MLLSPSLSNPIRSEYAEDPDYQELIEMLLGVIPDRMDGLRAAHAANNHDQLKVLAHQLKGSAGGYGFPQVSEIAGRLEMACHAGDPLATADRLHELLSVLARLSL